MPVSVTSSVSLLSKVDIGTSPRKRYESGFGGRLTYRERADGNMSTESMRVKGYVFHRLPDTIDPRGPKR
jgi:hypothetical protein